LNEEKEILNRGIDNGNRLVAWYKHRLASVQKRAELLAKGMVAMEVAVHEQKLNFLRAHATELNRRIISLMESSDRGFPTHINLQVL
uniref:Suppressor of IKBKE 1 n=1 Tax=Syphacia muris TaxID=451379 RepID=A0A0N5AHP5_9BILA